MKAVVYHGPEDLRVEERPTPSASASEVVLHVDFASICATDVRILKGAHRKYGPGTVRIPGHEVVGTIAELGRDVGSAYRVGQRVFVAPNVGCGRCPQCLRAQNNLCANYEALGITMDGAFADFMRVPAPFLEQGNLIPLDDVLDGAMAALAEPFACVLHGQDVLHLRKEDVVLIIGSGPIGIMHVIAARAKGVRKILISGRSAERLLLAKAAGADRVIHIHEESLVEAVKQETQGWGADAIVVAAGGSEAAESAFPLAAIGGRINLFAGLPVGKNQINLDGNLIHYKELIVTGTTGCSTGDCRRSMELIRSGSVDLRPLISARYALDRAADAFAAVREGNVVKVVLQSCDRENL